MAPKTEQKAEETVEVPTGPPITLEERLVATEERLADALTLMATIAAQGEERAAAAEERGVAGKWDSLAQAEALQALQGTVSDQLEGDTLLEDVGERPVTFISKGIHFKSVRIGRNRTTAPNGELVVSKGVTYDFSPSGTYTALTVEAVTHLRSRGSMNREYWELGKEPHAAPDANGIMAQILEALGDFDDARLAEIETLETASHKREIVVKAVKKARRVVQGVVAEAEVPVA